MSRSLNIEVDRESTKPLYQQIKDSIEEKIETGTWPPDFKLPTYREMGESVGVSMITIQQSVGALVKEGVLYRKRGVGIFTSPAKVSPGTGSIGLLLPDVRHSFFAKLAHLIQNHAARHMYTTLIFSWCGSPEELVRSVELLPRQRLDGIIASPVIVDGFPGDYPQKLLNRSPIVFVDGRPDDGEYDFVETDNAFGVRLALNHLIELGHRRIGFAAGQILTKGVQERIEEFRKVLHESGLPCEPAQVQISVRHDSEAGAEAAHTFFALREAPTAVICMNDLVARGVMQVAKEQKASCPDDISIIGFDDLDFSQHLDPPLTTLRQPVKEIGETAVDILLEKVRNPAGHHREKKSVLLRPELIVRGTTAPIA